MKLCKDCKHASAAVGECLSISEMPRLEFVDGRDVITRYSYCAIMRMKQGRCGPEGTLWEPFDSTEKPKPVELEVERKEALIFGPFDPIKEEEK